MRRARGKNRESHACRYDPGSRAGPFRAEYTLRIKLPGGTPTNNKYQISVDQYAVDPETDVVGSPIGGNTYFVGLE
jgi:hypothetical protein